MKKKIAVVVRGRSSEALRMALGLTLMDDRVDVYLIGPPPENSEKNEMNLSMLSEVGAGLYSTSAVEGFAQVAPGGLPERLLGYDLVVPY